MYLCAVKHLWLDLLCSQQAIECVKKFGFFLAINDYVNTQDIDLGMSCLNLDRSYKIVDLSSLLISNNFEEKKVSTM